MGTVYEMGVLEPLSEQGAVQIDMIAARKRQPINPRAIPASLCFSRGHDIQAARSPSNPAIPT